MAVVTTEKLCTESKQQPHSCVRHCHVLSGASRHSCATYLIALVVRGEVVLTQFFNKSVLNPVVQQRGREEGGGGRGKGREGGRKRRREGGKEGRREGERNR